MNRTLKITGEQKEVADCIDEMCETAKKFEVSVEE